MTMLTRLSNDASILMMGLNSDNIAVMVDDIQDCKVNAKSILGEEPDFNLDARTLLAAGVCRPQLYWQVQAEQHGGHVQVNCVRRTRDIPDISREPNTATSSV